MPVKSARLPNPSLFAKGAIARLMFALGGDGEEIRIAGGAVRNAMLGLPANDIDCATTSLPKETIRRAERAGFHAIPTGIEHGTITVVVDGTPFEVTTLRADIATDGRRATVAFGRDFAADAARRDFTINALYADADGLVTDYVGGLDDIAAKRVRFIGDAATRIRRAYWLLFGRPATDSQIQLGLEFIMTSGKESDDLWRQYAQALLGGNEFLFID